VGAALERRAITAPIAFVALGVLLSHPPLQVVHLHLHSATLRGLAELALAVVLFVDASRVNVEALRADLALPVRLLGIGLPLTIASGAAVAAVVLGGPVWVAATVGAIVAPTDAALGASIFADERVPSRVRRVLNVESGLNDGIASPFVNVFLAAAVSAEVAHSSGPAHAVVELVGGAAIGCGIGLVGGWCVRLADARALGSPAFAPLADLALALCAYAAALAAGTNGFVAAFVAGLAFGSVCDHEHSSLGFAEDTGELLSLLVWFMFGAAMLVPGLRDMTWRDAVFALVALTVVRMVPVAIALTGTGLDRATVAFIGWFGPRGLASIVFGLIAVDALEPKDATLVLSAVTVTVALSVLAHGLTASPLAARYGRYAATLQSTRPELGRKAELRHRALRAHGGHRANARRRPRTQA